MPLLRRDTDLALLIVVSGWQHLGNADSLILAFYGKDTGLMSLDSTLLNVAFKR